MKQLFFYELKQNITRDISKNIFMVKRLEKVFSLNTVVDRNLSTLAYQQSVIVSP